MHVNHLRTSHSGDLDHPADRTWDFLPKINPKYIEKRPTTFGGRYNKPAIRNEGTPRLSNRMIKKKPDRIRLEQFKRRRNVVSEVYRLAAMFAQYDGKSRRFPALCCVVYNVLNKLTNKSHVRMIFND